MMNYFHFSTKVETKDNIGQWKIDRSYHQLLYSVEIFMRYSDVFKIGNWEWQLCLCKRSINGLLLIGLNPIIEKEDPSPIMFFTITVASSVGVVHETIIEGGNSIYLYLPGGRIREEDTIKMFQRDNVMWRTRNYFTGEFTVIVQFSGLKTTNPWAERRNKKRCIKKKSDKHVLASLGRMLSENIYSDVTISTSDGVKIGAHRAILASRSPVFHSMFSHDLQEQENSIINITDMSTKSCQVFFKYIYGNMEQKELLEHRLELVGAADKYDVPQLKEACDGSFAEDIDRKNVVEMLQIADTYRLPKLKSKCMEFLLKFGNIFEIQDEFNELLQSGDRDLVVEIFLEILKELKSYRGKSTLISTEG